MTKHINVVDIYENIIILEYLSELNTKFKCYSIVIFSYKYNYVCYYFWFLFCLLLYIVYVYNVIWSNYNYYHQNQQLIILFYIMCNMCIIRNPVSKITMVYNEYMWFVAQILSTLISDNQDNNNLTTPFIQMFVSISL